MSAVVIGRTRWSMARDREGHRDYVLRLLVRALNEAAGPFTILSASGMPTIGSIWSYGTDIDPWAFCLPTARVNCRVNDEPCSWWDVEVDFSTRPLNRCQDASIENPIFEPPKISGTFVELTKALRTDRNGKAILSSSHERILGLERDDSTLTVAIEWNLPSLDLSFITGKLHHLNDAELWGMPPRHVKFSRGGFSRRVYGLCNYYYSFQSEFDIRFEGFDLDDIADTGFKKYSGTGDRADPANYIIAKDDADENNPERILLDGNGDPLEDPENPVFIPPVEVYAETNLLELGIPSFI